MVLRAIASGFEVDSRATAQSGGTTCFKLNVMQVSPNTLYHIYNRGNNKQPIFFSDRNYSFFIKKAFNELKNELDFLAYCLMPNHFHFLVYTKAELNPKKFTNGMRTLLSSYTRAIQKQEQITGSLFQQNTKYKKIDSNEYSIACFHYIHQNPLKAKLVSKMEDWPYHSFNEYCAGKQAFCNIEMGTEILQIPIDKGLFYKESYLAIADTIVNDELY
jgi:putative transposase